MKEITIDCNRISDRQAFHRAMAQAFAFPEYYGNNLDAMIDCLTEVEQQTHLRLTNWAAMEDSLGDYAPKIHRALQIACQENDLLTVEII